MYAMPKLKKLIPTLATIASGLAVPSHARATCTPTPNFATTNVPGKRVLRHPFIQLIFPGAYWSGAGAAQARYITGAVQDMTNGPYFSALREYYGTDSSGQNPHYIGPVHLVPEVDYAAAEVPLQFTDENVKKIIRD